MVGAMMMKVVMKKEKKKTKIARSSIYTYETGAYDFLNQGPVTVKTEAHVINHTVTLRQRATSPSEWLRIPPRMKHPKTLYKPPSGHLTLSQILNVFNNKADQYVHLCTLQTPSDMYRQRLYSTLDMEFDSEKANR